MGYYVVRLVRIGRGSGADEEIASVRARTMDEAIAAALRRYPGMMAVHGELHAMAPGSEAHREGED